MNFLNFHISWDSGLVIASLLSLFFILFDTRKHDSFCYWLMRLLIVISIICFMYTLFISDADINHPHLLSFIRFGDFSLATSFFMYLLIIKQELKQQRVNKFCTRVNRLFKVNK